MVELDSGRWRHLTDAYGTAELVPGLLAQLSSFPIESNSSSEPWFSLWSRLYHQGDVYPASFAAVPHVVAAMATAPANATLSFFLLPAAIELARHQHQIEVASEFLSDYRHALDSIPQLAAQAAARPWDTNFCQSVLAAIAASRAQYDLSRLLMDIETSDLKEVLEWYQSR